MTLPVIPAPLHVTVVQEPPFVLDAAVRVVVDVEPSSAAAGAVRAVAAVVADDLSQLAGAPVPVEPVEGDTERAVVLRLVAGRTELGLPEADLAESHPGAYRLETAPRGVVVSAVDPEGLRNGASTLLQTARAEERQVTFPAAVVLDAPRFAWRGLSLDVARRFHGPATIRAVVRVMAQLRLNVLHLHLTDDQGWRIEIPSRPELTERSGPTAVDGGPAGHLTVADYADLVAFAAARGITVIPEIDVPGHVNAALHADGDLTPSGEPAPAYTGIEVGFSQLHADLPATDPFLRDVLGAVAAMTPGPYLHIGGDEALSMDPAEYRRLVDDAIGHVRAAGKRVVGWQEVATVDPGPGAVVQYWNEADGADHVIAAARNGADVLLSPARRVYLDLKYDADTVPGLEWAGHVEVRDSYDWEPLDQIPEVPAERVVGVEAAIWAETLRTPEDLFYLLLPRLAAVAEVAWSQPDRRDWDSFTARLPTLTASWDAANLPWYHSPQLTE